MSESKTIYLDTNILVSILTEDSASHAASEWFNSQVEQMAISEWVCIEFNGVTGLRTRKRELRREVANLAIETLQKRAQTNFIMLPVSNEAAALATVWLRNPDCTLQTGDALQLAIAHSGGATTFATFDERFAKAAQKLKLSRMKIELIGQKVRRVEQRRAGYVVGDAETKVSARTKTGAKVVTKKKVKR